MERVAAVQPAQRARATKKPRRAGFRGCISMPVSATVAVAVAGGDALPHVGQIAELALGEMREEVLPDDGEMGDAGRPQQLEPRLRQTCVGAARIVIARAALQQAVSLEAVDEPGQSAAG